MEDNRYIRIRGAREHNLKNINIDIPRNELVVMTGLSGSGKSSLAFDTIYAEGQRRYVESLSSYARMFLGQLEKPDIDSIEGLSPAISIDQKSTVANPRSTVGTVTEIHDYFRLLYARVGKQYCCDCGSPIAPQSIDQIISSITSYEEGTRIIISAPAVRGKKGEFTKLLDEWRRKGFARVKIDGITYSLDEEITLDKNRKHEIDVVIDRLVIRPSNLTRLYDSCETALAVGDGLLDVEYQVESEDGSRESFTKLYSQKTTCPSCGRSFHEINTRSFSFNNAYGACQKCSGIGTLINVDPDLCVQDPNKSINEGAVRTAGWNFDDPKSWGRAFIVALSEHYGFSLDVPYKDLPKKAQDIIMYGNNGEKLKIDTTNSIYARDKDYYNSWEGVVPSVLRRYRESSSDEMRASYERYMSIDVCPECGGARLNRESLAVKVGGINISELSNMSVVKMIDFFDSLKLDPRDEEISAPILTEIRARLRFLYNVGLEYMTLSRAASTLSGGEAQRIRLATQIGSGLQGVLYILDEPSIGLHQRDNAKLIKTLTMLRDMGNSVIVVEHDEETMRSADHLIDIGPLAGVNGGQIVAQGTVDDIIRCKESITGQYLNGLKYIPVPKNRRKPGDEYISIRGACVNNLKNIDVDIPIGLFTCITGVSGSGKSSLINSTLVPFLAHKLNGARKQRVKCDSITGFARLDKIIVIDQAPIGRTPRSNPATYIGVFDDIRKLYAATPDAKMRGYQAGRFSFNVKGGRCEACGGDGVNKIEMHFLPDIYVRCDVCKGKRYNRETLSVTYDGKNIADILEMTVDEACEFFKNQPKIFKMVRTLQDVGLGYIKLGQPSTTLSGGEAQRIKLASELSRKSTGKTLYILDEPTTGLHIADVHKLVDILERLTQNKNTVVVIEHNLDVIKVADHLIDLGPDSGERGGEVIACGTPEEICKVKGSFTGQFLKPVLANAKKKGQYADISEFFDISRLEEEALDIVTGPKVRRKIKEDE
ncbi:excinuclease ABC subunit A [Ruminococcaceae bacterium YRB3002]|nr:excinuclease ABC subunit A [Ruminococcaceae bacterium YRB3002]